MNFSIVIPIYNEGNNILVLINEIYESLNKINYVDEFEIIIVDDSSIDNSSTNIENYINDKKLSNIKLIINKKNIGQSYSLLEGIKKSKFNTILTLDGDLQNNPKDIPSLLKIYFGDDLISLIGGIRNKRKDNFVKIFTSKIANYVRRLILNDDCNDTGCALKIFDKKIFLSFPFFDGIHRFLPALYKGYGKKTKFINVDHRPRIYGKSNYGTLKRFFLGILHIYKVYKIINKNQND